MAVDDGRGAVQQVVQGVIVRVADLEQHAGYSIHKRVFLDDVETVLGTVYVCGFHGRVRWPTWVDRCLSCRVLVSAPDEAGRRSPGDSASRHRRQRRDRTRVGKGKSVAVGVDLGGCRKI